MSGLIRYTVIKRGSGPKRSRNQRCIMKLKNPMFVVTDMERSKEFYRNVLGLRVIMDLGANVTMTGGVALQTEETWKEFIGAGSAAVSYGGNDAELYFEEEDFDGFLKKIESLDVSFVHPAKEHSWGQRVVRLYDPDRHILEIGEDLKVVCRRFLDSGMSVEETAERMDVPVKFVQACIRK